MSIIYDALVKIQKSIESENIGVEQATAQKFTRVNLILICMIIGLIIILICEYYPKYTALFYKKRIPTVKKVALSTLAANQQLIPSLTSQNAQPVEMIYKGTLQLNGIFISDQDKIVLINNHPLHVGDIIEGKKIVNIEYDKVKLQEGSVIFIMKAVT